VVEGRNLAFEPRFADGQPDRLPGLAADLVRANVDIIVAVLGPGLSRRTGISVEMSRWRTSSSVIRRTAGTAGAVDAGRVSSV
jgi:hypothetical protein